VRKQLPGLIMGNIYYALLRKVVSNEPDNILNISTGLSPIKKILVATTTFFGMSWIK